MNSYTITEEPVRNIPLMFKRIQRECQEPVEIGNDVIVYIENRKKVFVRDSPQVIQGIADLLTLQGIPFRSLQSDQVLDLNALFAQLPGVS